MAKDYAQSKDQVQGKILVEFILWMLRRVNGIMI